MDVLLEVYYYFDTLVLKYELNYISSSNNYSTSELIKAPKKKKRCSSEPSAWRQCGARAEHYDDEGGGVTYFRNRTTTGSMKVM